MRGNVKSGLIGVGIMMLAVVGWNYKLINYGVGQAKGQLHILWNARPIEEVLLDPTFPDSLKETLILVEEIKQFAVDSIGLQPSDNYTKVFDQHGEEILWVVSACEPYSFEPRMWSFPIIGEFTYKGFFDKDKAISLVNSLKEEGLDVHIRPVSGWSTLGWFRDPILSNMLADGPGELSNTLIHELTHGTIFIPDSMTFNENLATFIGDKGALAYLSHKYGAGSDLVQDYADGKYDSKVLTEYIVKSTIGLDNLYKTLENTPDSVRKKTKLNYIDSMVRGIDQLPFRNPERYAGIYKDYKPNNAFLVAFLNYRERQAEFELILLDSMDNDIKKFVRYWRKQYGR